MSDTTDTTTAKASASKRGGGLNAMLLADLKALAQALGIPGTSAMKKAQVLDAIKAHQSGQPVAGTARAAADAQARTEKPARATKERATKAAEQAPEEKSAQAQAPAETTGEGQASATQPTVTQRTRTRRTSAKTAAVADEAQQSQQEQQSQTEQPRQAQSQPSQASEQQDAANAGASEQSSENAEPRSRRQRERERERQRQQRRQEAAEARAEAGDDAGEKSGEKQQADKQNQNQKQNQNGKKQGDQGKDQNKQGQDRRQGEKDADRQNQNQNQGSGQEFDYEDEDEDGNGRRNRRRRGRERNVGRQGNRNEPDTTILEDDVLVPAAGILDVLDNYAFVRTSGYLPGTDDVYLSLSMVRKYGLRRGDAVVGQVRQPREGERREKFNPMVRIDQVNGLDPEAAKERPEFDSFVPVHPSERLRLETGRENLLGRIVDVFAPIGKGQRGMVLSPPRSGKTQVLQTMAAAIRENNPECHLMVLLVDERPEEVTDYQRTVRGEVVASTFDRPAADHVLLAELAVERAKRLVEMGHDVVMLVDSLTRLARAYNVTAPGSGRQGSGGVDAVALHPAKRLFGAARNVEDGGSLTILSTVLVESGSPLDEAVLDEFNDTANMDLRLRRELVERRIFPPVDVVDSGTRREEHLLTPAEQQATFKLRSALMDLGPREALTRVLDRMASSSDNEDFLAKVAKASEKELSGS